MKLYLIFSLPMMIAAAVNIYGDSLLAPSSSPITHDLSKIYNNTDFNNYALIGSKMTSGWVKSIPEQYLQHHQPIPKSVIMNGGGGDVFSMKKDCVIFNNKCRVNINHISVLIHDMFSLMTKNGVKNIIYLGYYHNGDLNKAVDYGSEKILEVCNPINNCYFVDLRNVSISTTIDNIYPDKHGYHMIIKAIQQTIQHYKIRI